MRDQWRRWIYRSRPLARRLLHEWSIGVSVAASPLEPDPDGRGVNPALTAGSDPSPDTAFVADPFVVRDGSRYWMFFEAMSARTGRGEIALASSADGVGWTSRGSVITEPFHMSFPCVIDSGDDVWMTPETRAAHSVRLYVAEDFPRRWRPVADLLTGDFVDPCVFRRGQHWWLFATSRRGLHLFYSSHVTGPWIEHPHSPVVRDPGLSRSAGRPIDLGPRLVRLAQNSRRTHIQAFDIVQMSTTSYVEREAAESPIAIARNGWNEGGIHHLNACARPDGLWLVAVDGRVSANRSIS
jgi:hypothetical protein